MNDIQNAQEEDRGQKLRPVFGSLLVVGGTIVCGAVLQTVYAMLNQGKTLAFVDALVSPAGGTKVMGSGGMSVEMPPAMLQFGAYGVAIALMYVAGRIGLGLIAQGGSLLSPDMRHSVDKLSKALEQKRS